MSILISILVPFFGFILLYSAYLIVASVIYDIRHPNAHYFDTPLGKFFGNVAEGIRSKAIEDMKKKDPEWKKKWEELGEEDSETIIDEILNNADKRKKDQEEEINNKLTAIRKTDEFKNCSIKERQAIEDFVRKKGDIDLSRLSEFFEWCYETGALTKK